MLRMTSLWAVLVLTGCAAKTLEPLGKEEGCTEADPQQDPAFLHACALDLEGKVYVLHDRDASVPELARAPASIELAFRDGFNPSPPLAPYDERIRVYGSPTRIDSPHFVGTLPEDREENRIPMSIDHRGAAATITLRTDVLPEHVSIVVDAERLWPRSTLGSGPYFRLYVPRVGDRTSTQ